MIQDHSDHGGSIRHFRSEKGAFHSTKIPVSNFGNSTCPMQGLQILLMSGVTVTSASQILESFWKIWSQVSQRKKPFADFTARGPGMNNYRDGYTV